MQDNQGVPASPSGHSAEPEPPYCAVPSFNKEPSGVSAPRASVPNAKLPRIIEEPLGEHAHHCDVQFTAADRALGGHLAYHMGTLFSDVGWDEKSVREYFYRESTAVNEWSRVARALRVHGLKIVEG